jgi:hypothetical protein
VPPLPFSVKNTFAAIRNGTPGRAGTPLVCGVGLLRSFGVSYVRPLTGAVRGAFQAVSSLEVGPSADRPVDLRNAGSGVGRCATSNLRAGHHTDGPVARGVLNASPLCVRPCECRHSPGTTRLHAASEQPPTWLLLHHGVPRKSELSDGLVGQLSVVALLAGYHHGQDEFLAAHLEAATDQSYVIAGPDRDLV